MPYLGFMKFVAKLCISPSIAPFRRWICGDSDWNWVLTSFIWFKAWPTKSKKGTVNGCFREAITALLVWVFDSWYSDSKYSFNAGSWSFTRQTQAPSDSHRVCPGDKILFFSTPTKSWKAEKLRRRVVLWLKWLKSPRRPFSMSTRSLLQAYDAERFMEWHEHLTVKRSGKAEVNRVETEWCLPNIVLQVSALNPMTL